MSLIEKFRDYSKEEILKELNKNETIEEILNLTELELNSISNIISNKITENPQFKESCNEETIECNIFNQLKELEYTFIFHKINKTLSSSVTSDKVEEGAWYRTWKEDIATLEELEDLKKLSNVEEQKEYVQQKINENRESIGMSRIFDKNTEKIVEFKKAIGGEPDIIMVNPKTGKISFCMANKFVNNKMEGTQDTRHLALIFETIHNMDKPLDYSLFGDRFKKIKKIHKGKGKETQLWNRIVETHSEEELSKILNENYSISFYQHYSTTINSNFEENLKENDKTEVLGILNSFMFLAQNAYNTQGKYSLTNYTNVNTFNPTNKENLGTSKTLELFEKEFQNMNIEDFKDLMNIYEVEECLEFQLKDSSTIIDINILETYKSFLEEHFPKTFKEYLEKHDIEIGNNEEEIESNLLYLFDLENLEDEELNDFKEEVISVLIQYESFKRTKIKYHKKDQNRKKINGRKTNNLNAAIKIGFTRDKEFREGLFGLLVHMAKYHKSSLLDNELPLFEEDDEDYYKFYEKYNIGSENYPWISQKMLSVLNKKKSQEILQMRNEKIEQDRQREEQDRQKEEQDRQKDIVEMIKNYIETTEYTLEEYIDGEVFTMKEYEKYRIKAEEEIFWKKLGPKGVKLKKEMNERGLKLHEFLIDKYFSSEEDEYKIREQINGMREQKLEKLANATEEELERIIQNILKEKNIDISKEETKELSKKVTKGVINKFGR